MAGACEDGETRGVSFPLRLDDTETTIENTLPDVLPVSACLYVKTNYQQVTVEVGAQTLLVTGMATSAEGAGTYELPWTRLTLADDMAGETIRLTFSQTGNKPFVEVYSVRLGDISAIQLSLLSKALPSMVMSLLVLIFALALLVFAILEARRHNRRLPGGYLFLIVFLALAGVWFYTDTDISGIRYLGSTGFFYVNYISYLLMPIPFFLFVCFRQASFRRLSLTLSGLLAVNLIAQIVLTAAGRALLWVGLSVSHALLTVAALAMPWLFLHHRPVRNVKTELYNSVFITAFTGLITLALYYLLPIDDNASVFRYGVLVMVIALTVDLLRANEDIVIEAHRIEQLRIREEEYRIAARQSDKHVLRFDVGMRALMQGEEPSPLFNGDRDIPNLPESLINEGGVAEESEADFRTFFTDILAGKPAGMCTVSLRAKDGRFAWFRADYTLIFTDDGQPSQAVVSLSDVTEQRQKELAYQKWKQTYADMPAESMNYYEYNLTRGMLTGESGRMIPPPPEAARSSLPALIHHLSEHHVAQEDRQRFRVFFDRDRLVETFERGVRNDQLEFRRVDAEGRPLWTIARVQLFPDPYSNDTQSFLLLQDEDDAKRDEMRVRARSNNDPLTGLLNRTAFEDQLTQLFACSTAGMVHALLMIDMDGFKHVNDTFGHQFGDRVLTDVANSLRAATRSGDLIGRIGGDEYMVCFQNIPQDTGFLEKRAAALCRTFLRHFDNDVSISASIGIALYPRDGRAFAPLYRKADQALYYAKHHGKNHFVFFREGLEQEEQDMTETADHAPAPAKEREQTLLIVSDAEANRSQLSDIFQDEYILLTAVDADGCACVLKREPNRVSAVVMDLSASEADGLSLLRRIRQTPEWTSIPVIVVTAADGASFSFSAVEQGATDFVQRPFDAWLVKLRVQSAIRKREAEELRAQNHCLLVQKSGELRHQSELRYIADHDPLTNICNKAAFYRKTKEMLNRAPATTFVMIAFDIEKFRLINDIFGHEEGDRLLRFIAQQMQSQYTDRATYSRIDADNFALCLPYDPEALKRNFVESDQRLREYDLPFEILLVFGLYIIDDLSLPVSIMHDRAEMAKRIVKGNYMHRYAFYDDQLRKTMLDELEIVNDMNAALRNHQFEVYLQPKCMLANGEIVGAEALVRWNHPTRGLLMPGAFVPVFEKNGFIMQMDAYIWEQVCILLRRWMDRFSGQPPLAVSMNVSRVDIYNPALVDTLCQLSERYGIPRRYMELEITESAYTQDPKLLSDLIAALRKEGFIVEMDDFGSAYSSLNMLKEIHVDSLKLDMRFLYGDDQDGRGGTILSSVVRMARYLALPIVAEGVETAEQARFLASIGCTQAQGYYFYRPMPVADFERLLTLHPVKVVDNATGLMDEAAVRRVWSISGDFSLMLSTIPCAASLYEMTGSNIELLRVNDEYLTVTRDHAEHIYSCGGNVRSLTTREGYQCLLDLFKRALEARGIAEGVYERVSEDGSKHRYHMKARYLAGDNARALFFVTYLPRTDGKPSAAPEDGARLRCGRRWFVGKHGKRGTRKPDDSKE